MEPSVYLETSVISYLAAHASQDLIVAAHQRVTAEWWRHRARFRLYVSELVLQEASAGDAGFSARRREYLAGIPVLDLRDDATRLAQALVQQGPIPVKAAADALHLLDAAIDVLDCQKAAILKYKASKIDDKSTYEERQAAVATARVAWDRCLKARGWKKNE